MEPPTGGTERLTSIRVNTVDGAITIINAYAPTLVSSSESKDQFYGQLDEIIKSSSKDEPLVLLGDFNARVGSDHQSWPTCIGHHGIGKINENGQRLL